MVRIAWATPVIRLDFLRATLLAPFVAMIPKGERDPAGDDKPRERERRRAFKNDQVYSNGEWNDEIIQEHINNGRRIDLNGCDRLPKNTPLVPDSWLALWRSPGSLALRSRMPSGSMSSRTNPYLFTRLRAGADAIRELI